MSYPRVPERLFFPARRIGENQTAKRPSLTAATGELVARRPFRAMLSGSDEADGTPGGARSLNPDRRKYHFSAIVSTE